MGESGEKDLSFCPILLRGNMEPVILHYKEAVFHEADACLITLNEEENIKKCLDNIYNIVDGIIIIDGGSQDKTIEIIKSYNDIHKKIKLYVNDFFKSSNGILGDQKNLCISKSNSLWVLYMDPDEVLNDNLIKDFRKIIRENQDKDVIDFIRYNYIDNKPEKLFEETLQLRLFKSFCRYVGTSHHELCGQDMKHRYILLDNKYHMIHNKSINRAEKNWKFYDVIESKYPHKHLTSSRLIQYEIKEC